MSFRPARVSLVPFRLSLLLLLMLFAGGVAVNAQTVIDPKHAQFNASTDHNATNSDGSPALDHYELEFYMVGASQPFQTVGLGKPTPDGTGGILVDFSTLLVPVPAGGIVYNATVAAVGPGGRTSSALSIDSFEFSTTCTYTISPTAIALTSAGGTGSITVTAPNGCAWTASEGASWLSITAGASGSGNGTVSYSATANSTSSSQNTTMTVAGQAVSVTEAGAACTFTVSPTTIALTSAGGTGSVTVSGPSGCAWTASEGASWLSITAGASGSGNGTVSYSATANSTSSSQNTTMTVAGQAVSVTEAGAACTFTVSPTTIALTSAGGTGSVTVSGPSGCAWTATENASWLSITGGASGSGNGTVTYAATANTTSSAQNTTMTIAGRAVAVSEAGAACTLTVSPASIALGSGGGTGSVSVSVPGGCAWTATSNASWFVVTSGAGASGNGTVTYSATVNPSTTDRNATLTIGGQAIAVTEAKRLAAPTGVRVVRP